MEAHDSQKIKQEKFPARYDDRLIFDIIAYFKASDGTELTSEEAELYLDSLAQLGHAMKESIRQGFVGGGDRAKRDDPKPSSYLYSLNR